MAAPLPNANVNAGVGNANPEVDAHIAARVTLPCVWRNSVSLWLTKAEGLFALHQIQSQRSKFNLVLQALTEEEMLEVSDVIRNPPAESPYDALKAAMTERFGKTNDAQIKEVLDGLHMGDRSPSSFWRILKDKAGANFPEATLKSIWRSRLPEAISAIIAAHDAAGHNVGMEVLCNVADTVHLHVKPVQVFAAAAPSPPAAQADPVAKLCQQIEALTKRLSRFELQQQQQSSRGRSPSPARLQATSSGNSNNRGRGRSASRTRGRMFNGICYFHHKFGAAARNCLEGCTYAAGSGNANAPN